MARSPSDPKVPTLTIVQSLAVASQFGIALVVAVVLGFFVGQWLDSHLNTGIVFTLIGVLLGLTGTAANTVNTYRAALRRSESESAQAKPQSDATTTSAPEHATDGTTEG